MKILVFTLFISAILASCNESDILFYSPQPKSAEPILKIDSKVCGLYISLLDSTMIKIEPGLITLSYFINLNNSKTKIDSTTMIKNDTLWLKNDNEALPITYTNDSNQFVFPLTDTLFNIDSNFIVKYSLNHYFINKKVYHNYYDLYCFYFKPKKGVLYIKKLYKADRDLIERITPVLHTNDTLLPSTKIVIDPSRNQLKRLLRKNIFRISSVYKKTETP